MALFIATALAPGVRGAITSPYSADGATALARGVRHEWGTLVAGTSRHLQVNVVEVDPTDPTVDVRLSQADGIATHRRVVTEQGAAYGDGERRVVGAVNGSTFFYLVDPDGLMPAGTGQGLNVSDGELINAGAPVVDSQIMAFGIDDSGSALIGSPDLQVQLTLPGGGAVDVDRINQKRLENEVVLFTPRFDTHTWTDSLGDEYVVEGFDLPLGTTGTYSGTVVAAHDGAGDNALEPDQVVISVADGAAADFGTLATGDSVTLTMTIDEPWREVTNSVGGRNVLVVDGASVVTSKGGVHPRTAVGIKADGNLIMLTADNGTVDSGGMTLPEMAQLMLSLGAVDAVNLDGGGSTQMAVRQPGQMLERVSTLQTPAEGIRPVSNALQVVSSGPLTADSTPPVVDQPRISLAAAGRIAKRTAAINVDWSASDDSGISEVDVETRIGSGDWRRIELGQSAASGAALQVPYRQELRVRVRATDGWGNTSAWVESATLRVRLVDDGHSAVVRSGGWRRRADSHSIGGAYRRSKTTSAVAELSFTGYQVGLVGRIGPRGGTALVSLDDETVAAADTYAATADHRRLLYLGAVGETATAHLVRVRNGGTSARPLVDIDAFVVLEEAP